MSLKYRAGLFLIGAALHKRLHTSAEVTQDIFADYKQPFAVTYLGASLMAVYLQIAFLKDWICGLLGRSTLESCVETVDENQKCIFINWPSTNRFVVFRSFTDFMYLLHILFQNIILDGNEVILSEGDVRGEELVSWCLEQSPINEDAKKMRILGQRLVSNKLVSCITNVQAFSLRAVDIEVVISLYSRILQNPRILVVIRYESAYWRSLDARRIQVAWRYRKKRLS